MEVCAFETGTTPVLMSIPHLGTAIPEELQDGMTDGALALPDTDWALDRLYDFTGALGLSVLKANYSRYLIDLNRAPDGSALYPGASNTELVPTTTFDEAAIYQAGREPDTNEIERRRRLYWQPYHDRLISELNTLRDRFGRAVLFDCHSIRSRVPRFFEGTLPDFNLGTAGGASCAPVLRDRLSEALGADSDFSLAVDGRFKGGYITRTYGRLEQGVHAFQLELSQATYGAEGPPFVFDEALAELVRPALKLMLEAAVGWAET